MLTVILVVLAGLVAAEDKACVCRCPPSAEIWQCTEDDYKKIANGTSCAYYKTHAPPRACGTWHMNVFLQTASTKTADKCEQVGNTTYPANTDDCVNTCLHMGIDDITGANYWPASSRACICLDCPTKPLLTKAQGVEAWSSPLVHPEPLADKAVPEESTHVDREKLLRSIAEKVREQTGDVRHEHGHEDTPLPEVDDDAPKLCSCFCPPYPLHWKCTVDQYERIANGTDCWWWRKHDCATCGRWWDKTYLYLGPASQKKCARTDNTTAYFTERSDCRRYCERKKDANALNHFPNTRACLCLQCPSEVAVGNSDGVEAWTAPGISPK